MKMTQAEINKMTVDLTGEATRLSIQIAEQKRRIEALSGQGSGMQDDLPEYYCPVSRASGTVGGDSHPDPGIRKQRRELSPETDETEISDSDLPEYYVPVNPNKGTVGE